MPEQWDCGCIYHLPPELKISMSVGLGAGHQWRLMLTLNSLRNELGNVSRK